MKSIFQIPIKTFIIIGIVGHLKGQEMSNIPQTVVTEIIDTTIDTAFEYIVPVELSHIFKRYKNLPAIVKTDETEKWIRPGLTRTVYFEDGTTAKESLLTVDRPHSFSYKIEDFTSPLRHLAKKVEGDWVFTPLEDGRTKIQWTYKVIPRNSITRIIIKQVLLPRVHVLLSNAMRILKNDLEQ